MTEEQLIEANRIRKEIDEIKAHKAKLEWQIKQVGYEPWQYTKLVLKWANDGGEYLSSRFLLCTREKLLQLYFDEIDKAISQLEEQFSNI